MGYNLPVWLTWLYPVNHRWWRLKDELGNLQDQQKLI